MEDLLAHPAIQGGIAPFVAALILSLVFLRVNLLAGFILVAGFAIMVMMSTGFSFSPLTSTRKLSLCVLLIPVIAFLLHFSVKNSEHILKISYGLIALAIVWILWPVIMRHSFAEVLIPVVGYIIYAAWMMSMFVRMSELPGITAGTSAFATCMTIGGVALIGASALLGQMGIAFGSAAAAFLLVQLLFQRDDLAGITFTMTSGLMTALLLPAAIVYAKVPWVVLPIVALIPLIAMYPFEDERLIWRNTISLLAIIALPAGLALYLTWKSAGALLL